MAALSRAVSIPLMADEAVATEHNLVDVIRQRAATVVQTKIAKNGGIYRVLRLWHLAAAAACASSPATTRAPASPRRPSPRSARPGRAH